MKNFHVYEQGLSEATFPRKVLDGRDGELYREKTMRERNFPISFFWRHQLKVPDLVMPFQGNQKLVCGLRVLILCFYFDVSLSC